MLKIVLAENQAIFRAGAAKVLAVEDDMRVVAQVQVADQLIPSLEKFRPNILLLSSEFHAQMAEVVAAGNTVKARTVIVAENGDELKKFVEAGAGGVVFRSVTGTDLVQCVRKVS